MNQLFSIILGLIGLAWFVAFSGFSIISYKEREKRAARISLVLAVSGTALFLLAMLLPLMIKLILLIILGGVGLVIIVLLFLPIGKVSMGNDSPQKRYDERDIVFARAHLKPDSAEFESYYQMRPEKLEIDNRTRAKAGLLSPNARLANPYLFASPEGSFFLTESLSDAVDGSLAQERLELPVDEMTAYLKNLAGYYGALDVGITELKPYHVYSHIGRGSGTYGAPVPVKHRYAIALSVEMDFEMMGASPQAQTVMESAKQYVESARVAVQLAATIRALGFPARAHIDGNYRVIAPLVARDAGLGEIGRMGLLMTPRHGPRVRLSVVTTDTALIPDGRVPDPAVIDFCNICSKCAECCPSKSISFEKRAEIDGVLRWQINPETCFHYWNVIGTDCGRCMAVCPYSHPSTFSHDLIRWGNSKSGAFRRGANWLDDLFYGTQPAPRDAPDWTRVP